MDRRPHEMAAHTLAPHHGGVAVGKHHRARGGVFPRRRAADLSRGRAGRLHLDRRAHPRRENSDRAAVPPGARGVRLGAAGGPRRPRRRPGRRLPARAHGRDRLHRARRSRARRELRLHRAPQQPHPQFLRRGGRTRARVRAGAGHQREARLAGRDHALDQARRLPLPAPPRRPASRRAARRSGAASQRATPGAQPPPHPQVDPPRMSDLFLGIADPEFWRNCGYALLATGLIGTVAVILLLERKPRLQKGLALLFIAMVLAGLGVTRFGNNALLSEARERAREAELELAKLKTPRTLTPEAQRRVAATLQKFAGQEFEGQVAPGSEDARPLWEELDKALRAANWVRMAPSGLAVGDPPAGIPLSPTSGVTVFVTASRANELAPTAQALAAALTAEGLIAGVTASAGPRMEQRPNVIVIEIGRKPS